MLLRLLGVSTCNGAVLVAGNFDVRRQFASMLPVELFSEQDETIYLIDQPSNADCTSRLLHDAIIS